MMNLKGKFTRTFFLALIAIMLISACQPVNLQDPPNRKTPLFEYASEYERRQQAVESARQFTSRKSGMNLDAIRVLSVEQNTWPDICLGLPEPDEMCPGDQTRGFLILLSASGQIYEAHTDATGLNVRLNEPLMTANSPQDKAIQLLATQLNIAPTEILVQSIQPVQWPDSCLGITGSGTCLAVITPGFRIILEARGQRFEYHSNQDASLLYGGMTPQELPSTSGVDPLSAYLTVSLERRYFSSTMIEQLLISADNTLVISNNEGMEKRDIRLTESEMEQLRNWKESFGESIFTIREENAGWEATVHLYGQGTEALPDFGQEVLVNFLLELYARESDPATK